MNFDNVISVRVGKTIYRDGDITIKLFSQDYSKADVLNEALNTARVGDALKKALDAGAELHIHIPHLESVTKVNGQWAIETHFIEGKTMQQLMDENPDKLDELLEQFVALQMEVQSLHCPMLSSLKEKMQKKISATGLDATTRYDLHTRLEGMKTHNKLCHGDFNPSNIIITPEGKAYILDWNHATQGNASADVARTYLLFALDGKQELADRYLRLFCKKSDTAIQYVQKWIPIVAASQSVKGKPEERELLLKWVDVVEYE